MIVLAVKKSGHCAIIGFHAQGTSQGPAARNFCLTSHCTNWCQISGSGQGWLVCGSVALGLLTQRRSAEQAELLLLPAIPCETFVVQCTHSNALQ